MCCLLFCRFLRDIIIKVKSLLPVIVWTPLSLTLTLVGSVRSKGASAPSRVSLNGMAATVSVFVHRLALWDDVVRQAALAIRDSVQLQRKVAQLRVHNH